MVVLGKSDKIDSNLNDFKRCTQLVSREVTQLTILLVLLEKQCSLMGDVIIAGLLD